MAGDSREQERGTQRSETEKVGKPVQGYVIELVNTVGREGPWVDVPGAGPCGGWERESLVTMSIAFTHLTWFMLPRAWLLGHRQVHRQGQGICGQEKELHSWGGRCLQLVAAVMGVEKAGKRHVRQGLRCVHHFLLSEGLLCWC